MWGEALFEKKNLQFPALIYEMLKNSENLPDPRKRHESLISDRIPISYGDMLKKGFHLYIKEHFWKVSFDFMDSTPRNFPDLGQKMMKF